MPLERLQAGVPIDAIPAGTWNEFCNAAEKVARLTAQPAPRPSVAGGDVLTVQVHNNTGADLDADRPIVKLGNPWITTDDNAGIVGAEIVIEGEACEDNLTVGRFGVLLGPAASGATRAAVISGPVWCKVDVVDAGDEFAAPYAADQAKLKSGSNGARILWKPTGTGEKWALVMLSGGGSSPGNVILAQVNESGGVLASATTFDFDSAIAITGTGPEDGEGTAHKQASKAPFSNNDWVVLFQRTDNGEWWTDEKTSGEVDWITAIAEAHIPNDAYGESVLADSVTAEAPHASLGTLTALNKTGRFIFKGATCVIAESDSTRRIIATDSPTIVQGTVDDEAYSDELAGYVAWKGLTGEQWTLDLTGLTVTLDDPLFILDSVADGDKVVFAVCEVDGALTFTAIATKRKATTTPLGPAIARITGDVPARGPYADGACTPGKLEGGAELLEADPSGDEFLTLIPLGITRDVWNLTLTPLNASGSEDGVIVGGIILQKGDPEAPVYIFVITSDKDFVGLPGFVKSSPQIAWHDVGDNDFQLDADQC